MNSIGLFTGRAELIPSDILSQFSVSLALGTSLRIRNLPVCIGTSELQSHLEITLFREAGQGVILENRLTFERCGIRYAAMSWRY